MRPTPYVASLRIYEPIDSFEVANQLRWSQIIITSPTSWDEQKRALTRTINNEPPALKLDGAHVLDHEGKRYVAPWSTAARCWAALDDFQYTLPADVIKFFVPQTIEDSIRSTTEIVEDRFHISSLQLGIFHLVGLHSFIQRSDYVVRMRMAHLQ